MTTLNLIGCGRAGKALASLFHDRHVLQIQDVFTTSLASAKRAVDFIGAGRAVGGVDQMRPADLWMLAVPDRQIANSAAELARNLNERHPVQQAAQAMPLVFHCSGSLAASVLAPLSSLGWATASAHCILSFANAQTAKAQFSGTPCAMEGDALAIKILQPLFTAIGARCFEIQSEQKLLYHAAAVFATNFLPVLQNVADTLWLKTGVPDELLPDLRKRLLQNATTNILTLGPTAALTGPAARGDMELVNLQAQALSQWDEPTAQAYRALSNLARRMVQNDTHSQP